MRALALYDRVAAFEDLIGHERRLDRLRRGPFRLAVQKAIDYPARPHAV
jgi:hypothetical protein